MSFHVLAEEEGGPGSAVFEEVCRRDEMGPPSYQESSRWACRVSCELCGSCTAALSRVPGPAARRDALWLFVADVPWDCRRALVARVMEG